ncbi:MAG TPA: hypothetical protein VJ044_01335, partial [Candidatus Hodarchaeales archaeon]|nr:hypothetical protein [Candidatus Hodarchaeales archaeon]
FTSNTLTFEWQSNSGGIEYRYRLEDSIAVTVDELIDYTSMNRVTFELLDDGLYRFSVYVRHVGRTEFRTYERQFRVMAITGPILNFVKLKSSAQLNSETNVAVWIQDVDQFSSVSMKIRFDNAKINLKTVLAGDFVSPPDGFSQLIVPDFSDNSVLSAANTSGTINVAAVVLAGKSTGTAISGSMPILNFVFRGIGKGSSDLEIVEFELRDPTNKLIQINGRPQKARVVIN